MTQFDEQTKARMDRMIAKLRKKEQSQSFKRDEKLTPQSIPKPQERPIQGATQEIEIPTKEAEIIPFPTAHKVPTNCWTMTPDIIRSALFGIAKRGVERELLDDELICAVGGTEIRFTGKRLDQADMDVFMQALTMSMENGLGAKVYFSKHTFLKALKRPKSKQSYEWLEQSLSRLSACSVRIITKRYKLTGSLIDTFIEDDETGQYYLRFSPEVSKALQFQTYIPQGGRLKLGRSELAKWLYSYILSQSTDIKPHVIWSYTLQELTGSKSCIKKFNQNIKRAFKTIEKELPELLESWSIVQGKIQFQKKPYSNLNKST